MSQYWARKRKVKSISFATQRLFRYFKVSCNIIEIFQNFNKHFYLDNFDDEHEWDRQGQDNDEERESRHQQSTDSRPLLALWQTLSSGLSVRYNVSQTCQSVRHIRSLGPFKMKECIVMLIRNVIEWCVVPWYVLNFASYSLIYTLYTIV